MLRELTRDEQAVVDALRACPFSAAELAGPDLTVNMVEKIRKGEARLSMAQARSLARRIRRWDPEGALRLLGALLGVDEYVVARAVPVDGTAEVSLEVQEGVTASARTLEARLRGAPLHELEALAQDAVRETTEALVAVRSLIPQPAFRLEGCR